MGGERRGEEGRGGKRGEGGEGEAGGEGGRREADYWKSSSHKIEASKIFGPRSSLLRKSRG